MNKFRIELKKISDESGWTGYIYVDDCLIEEDWTIDWIEMAKSAIEPGGYFIFTCGCGVPECAGIYDPVMVTHTDDAISWDVIKPKPVRHFEFSKVEYREVLLTFLREVAGTVPRPLPGKPFLFSHICFWETELDWCIKTLETGERDNSGWW